MSDFTDDCIYINRNIMLYLLTVTPYKVHKDKLFNILENNLFWIFRTNFLKKQL